MNLKLNSIHNSKKYKRIKRKSILNLLKKWIQLDKKKKVKLFLYLELQESMLNNNRTLTILSAERMKD
jgi:hypothetical protein